MKIERIAYQGRLTDFAHSLWEKQIQRDGIVLDATLGNGHDAAFIASLLESDGKLYGIDIQAEAVESSRQRLITADPQAAWKIACGSHADWKTLFPEIQSLDFVCFNLGYLPGGDHEITTHPNTTLAAIKTLLSALKAGGALSLMVYRGHGGGREEYEAVLGFFEEWPQGQLQVYETGQEPNPGPCLVYYLTGN